MKLSVNGEVVDVDQPDDTALLWVLRDDLGLGAAKYGCGVDQCGACRVLVDGVSTSACRLSLQAVDDRAVLTLEALRETDEGRLVIDALLAHNAGQCGYCLPGIAVTLIALARRRRRPDRAEIIRALDDHLCRCGAHPRILRAAFEALEGARANV